MADLAAKKVKIVGGGQIPANTLWVLANLTSFLAVTRCSA